MDQKTAIALLNAINELRTTIKSNAPEKKPTERDRAATKLGRGGKANGKSVDSTNASIDAISKELDGVLKSVRSGAGKKLSDSYKALQRTLDPMSATFSKLDKAIQKSTDLELDAAKAVRDHIKANNGNVDSIKTVLKTLAEYTKVVNNLAAVQGDQIRDEKKIADALAEELKLRTELNKSGLFDKDVASKGMQKYFNSLSKDSKVKLSANGMKHLSTEVENLNAQFKTMGGVTTTFIKTLNESIKTAAVDIKQSISQVGKFAADTVKTELTRFYSVTQSRMMTGFGTNEFTSAIRMGVSAAELNTFRSQNREVLNAMSGYKPGANLMANGQVNNLQSQMNAFGLLGTDALNAVGANSRAAYNTGRQYDAGTNMSMLTNAGIVQQAMGGTIAEASAKINDVATQVYNVQKFNEKATKQEQETLEKELRTRMLLTRYMGYDIEYMKQQDQMRHNAQFGDIADRIRGAVMGEVNATMMQGELGWNAQQKELWSKSRRPGAKLTDAENQQLLSLNADVAGFKRGYEGRASAATGVSGFINAIAPNIAIERTLGMSGGASLQDITDNDTLAMAQRRSRGDISAEQYVANMTQSAKLQRDSVSAFDMSVLQFGQFVNGMKSAPGSGLASGALSIGGSILGGIATQLLTNRIMRKLPGGGGGGGMLSGLLGRFGKGGSVLAKSVPPPIPADAAAILGKAVPKAGAEVAKTGGKTLLKKIPGIGLMAGLGFGAGRAYGGDMLGATLEGASGIASTVPVVGTAASLAIDGGIIGRDIAKANMSESNGNLLDKAIMAVISPSLLAVNLAVEKLKGSQNNNVKDAVDKVNQVERDAQGNIINAGTSSTAKTESLLEKIASLLDEQTGVINKGNDIAKTAADDATYARQQQNSVADHVENMATSISGMFTVNT